MCNRLLLIINILLVGILSGCQPVTLQHNDDDSPLPVTVRVDDVGYWLEEWQRILALPEDQLRLTLETREKEFASTESVRTRLRLALVLAAGPAPVRDQARALNLLKELDIVDCDESAKALAALLEQMIAEQQWSSDKITEVRTRLKETEARLGELERQLQELKDIEQTIQQRN